MTEKTFPITKGQLSIIDREQQRVAVAQERLNLVVSSILSGTDESGRCDVVRIEHDPPSIVYVTQEGEP